MSSTTTKARDLAATQSALEVPQHDTDRAAFFAALGFGVFPMVNNHSKRAYPLDWPNIAMTDPEEVEEFWRSFAPSGCTNMGLTLAGFTVVDVDPRNGGTASLAKLEPEYEPLPTTRTHHTASGPDSLHFIYRADPDRPLKSDELDAGRFPGIDIKTGRGALIIAPGSVINGHRYQVVNPREAAPAPPWLYEIQQGTRHPAATSVRSRTPSRASAGHSRAATLAELRALPPDDPGRGNGWLTKVAGHLARKHTDYPAYLDELREIDGESEVPHDKDNFMKTAESIWDREQAKPAPKTDEPPTSGRFEPTHLGEARRLRDWFGEDLRFVAGRGWLGWDGRRWVQSPSQVYRAVHEMSDRMLIEARALPDDDEKRGDRIEYVRKLQKSSNIRGVIEQASHLADLQASGRTFDADPYKLLVGNGVVDLKTGELLPNRRDFMITKGTTMDYDPKGECPKWDAFLKWAFKGDAELVDYVQRMVGEILIGHNDGQRAYFLYGPGGNGKSQLIDVIGGVVGDYYTQALPDLLTAQAAATHTEAEANLAGSRMVSISETRKGQILDESRFNRLSGDKIQRASHKGEKSFEFPTTFTMVMYGNIRPTIPFTEGVRRRVKVIHMDAKVNPAERVDNLSGLLLAQEGPAILAWAVRGAVRVASGERADDPPTVAKAVKDWQSENNPFGDLVTDGYLRVNPEGRISYSDLWAAYEIYRAHGGREFAKNRTQLGDRLIEWANVEQIEGIERPANAMKFSGKRERGFKGIETTLHAA
ncbi:phage/plasmid primase, P4 family [Streptomyces sp. VNUA24]|uniref:phage/plasmid primase, P4 family n=1 Tax=Streptomyces sp. VNUA24 TaxID=3031131 RepID=UPI0023B7E227|nr:phage/plasmid primase, P4 family [Streptomyces sp. VNUA24]WEH15021.1 phage/plasmid primase, P4 family [Streptomyces sp. VNUA24]